MKVKFDDLIGEKKKFEALRKHVINSKPVIVWGPPGIGKTSGAYAVADQLGLKVIEFNASDERTKEEMLKLKNIALSNTYVPILILLDEADGIKNGQLLYEILRNSKHPFILTANDLRKIPEKVQLICQKIRLYPPKIGDVLSIVRSEAEAKGIRAKYDQITTDVRSSQIAVLQGGEYYKNETIFDIVKKTFQGEIPDNMDDTTLIWLLGNVSNFLWGIDIYKAVQIIALADRTKQYDVLSQLPRGYATTKYPSYFNQISTLKKEKKKLKKKRGAKKK